MKTALELLGHTEKCGPNCCCRDLTEAVRLALDDVALLARYEMRETAAIEAEKMLGDCPHEDECAIVNDCTVRRIRDLPVAP